MAFQQALQASLEAVASSATILINHLKTNPNAAKSSDGLPLDPLENGGLDVQVARNKLLEAATALTQLGARPDEYLEHLSNSYQHLTCIRWLVDLNVLDHIPLDGSISYSDLATKANVPDNQLKGVVRMSAVNGFLEEPQPEHVGHNRTSALLIRDANFMNWARWLVNYSVPTALKFADATRRFGKTDAKNETAFGLAMDVAVPFFDHIRKTPEMTALFSGYMRNVNASRTWSFGHAVTGYDWASLPAGAVVVDVGGSHGQASVELAKAFPQLEFIVEDLPETVAEAQKLFDADDSVDAAIKSRIKFMSHDFFEPQPVQKGDIYFLRMILHDWPDVEALKILGHLQAVLQKKPSARVVIMDTLLPPPGSISALHERQLRCRDLMMMQVFNARERELDDWKALAAQVGLEVTNVQQPFGSVMGILEISAKTDAHAQRQESTDKVGEETSEKPVLICGAGISGLSLAQSLRKNGIPFRVFERDPAVDSRPQGYRLKLEADAAQALKESLTEDVYKSFESSCALHAVGETDFNPFSGQVIKSRAGGGLSGTQGLHASYTVDRSAFRTTLMTGIEESIEFGKEISSYEVDPETSTVVATFKDGAQVHGRFLVAADGLHSTVRRQHIPHAELVDTGGFCVYGKTVMSPELLALFPEKAMRWMTVVSDEAPMLQSALIGTKTVTLLTEPIRFSSESHAQHDLPADYVYWALIGPKERFGPDDITSVRYNKSPEQAALEAAKLVLDVTREWHPSIRALFELQDTRQASAIKVFSSLPKIQKWQSHSHVTVLGDSIHPMSPCGGVGANTALVDGARLAKVLVAAGGSPTVEAVAAFEEDMRQRAFRNICRSEIGSKMMFGAKSLVECEAAKF